MKNDEEKRRFRVIDNTALSGDIIEPNELDDVTQFDVCKEFVRQQRGKLLYCASTSRWFRWTGYHWEADQRRRPYHDIVALCARYSEDRRPSERRDIRKAAFAGGVERMAKSWPALVVTADEWDKDEHLLATPGGTIDLRNGETRAPLADNGITRITAVAPTDGADCPRWQAFLNESFGHDPAIIRFMQQWFGYGLTGSTREQRFMVLSGPGGNGKSVLVETLGQVTGTYHKTAPIQTFMGDAGNRHPTELAFLHGARLIIASEMESGSVWNEARIKSLTGGDEVTARFMRRDFFTYRPRFKITVVGNHRPRLQSVGPAMMRRLTLVPMDHKPKVIDFELAAKLRDEWPAILRWMINGAVDWYANGLLVPEAVETATRQYVEDDDLLAAFIAERCNVDPGNDYRHCGVTRLFEAWSRFAEASGNDPGSRREFTDELTKKGFPSAPKRDGRVKIGIDLKVQYQNDCNRE